MKIPAPLVSIVRKVPREALEITTFALGTVEPEGSFTSPEIPATPPADCAKTGTHANSNSAANGFKFMT